MLCQNLVPNPSFEYFTSCPSGFSQINSAVPWFSANTYGTPDFLNSCAPTGLFSVSTPNNFRGFQNARTGVGYAHIFVMPTIGPSDYREYIQVPLISPLVAGQLYEISFYVSLSDKSRYATNNLGVHISSSPTYSVGYYPMPYTPQINETSIISDTSNWQLISGVYLASGGEQYITIGNFYYDSLTAKTINNPSSPNFFSDNGYYIDDVCVTPVGGTGCLAALPINLLSFNAKQEGNNVKVYWKTATEINNNFFTIERSKDAISFEEIGEVKGAGNSHRILNYKFYDDSSIYGITYYRLKQTDFDGKYSYSQTIVADFKQDNDLILFPNPAKTYIKVKHSPSDNKYYYLIKNQLGIIVKEGILNEDYIINIEDLENSVYYLTLINEHQIIKSFKFIKN
tara:strand:- start:27640 stop:28833 length:1194 start_codon:yes stop_codon:yes gene_type:complete